MCAPDRNVRASEDLLLSVPPQDSRGPPSLLPYPQGVDAWASESYILPLNIHFCICSTGILKTQRHNQAEPLAQAAPPPLSAVSSGVSRNWGTEGPLLSQESLSSVVLGVPFLSRMRLKRQKEQMKPMVRAVAMGTRPSLLSAWWGR